MPQVILDKTGNEVIAMVVTRLPAQGQRVIGGLRCCFKRFRLELRHKKIIPVALVDQDRQYFRCRAQTSAPCPPIEWPLMLRLSDTGKLASISAGSSCTT